MSLDVSLVDEHGEEMFHKNITHNLNQMADKAGMYYHLWRPDEIDVVVAEQLIAPLHKGLLELVEKPDFYKQYNPPNGWGSYDYLVIFVKEYLQACILNPTLKVEVCR